MTRRLIGLTGGIATGKTTVSRYLADTYKLPIFDADVYAREPVKPRSPLLEDIRQRYGDHLILPEGSLNRQALGEIIFSDQDAKIWLESKIHPYVRKCFVNALTTIKESTVVLVIPLLFEAKMTDLVTEIWVVYCSKEEQIKRLKQRDRLNDEQAIARINKQLPIEEKIALADVVIDNSGSVENLFRQIDKAINPLGAGA